jgi:predicted PurR-regulated permease PerM
MSDQTPRAGRSQWAGLTLQQQLLLWSLALAVFAAVLYFLSPILAPFIAGTALGYLLDPVADRLQKLGLSRLGAALLILVSFILVVAAILLLIFPILSRQFAAFVTSLPGYIATLQGLLAEWSDKFTGEYLSGLLQKFGLGGAASTLDVQKYINDLVGDAGVLAGDFVKSLLTRGVALINVISLAVVTPVVAFYMLLDWDKMVDVCDQLVPKRHRADVRALARDIDKALAGFLRGQSLVCLFLGIWYSLGLSLIGLNFGFLIGVLAGLLSFIPYVGSLTAFVLSIIVALVQSWPDWRLPLEAIAVVSTGLFLDGNVLSPRLVGDAVGLHPVWLMFALFAFGALFGFTGLILAVPVAAALGVILRFVARRYRSSTLYLHPHTKA